MTDMPKMSDLLRLPPADRLAIAEALWSSLTTEPDGVPVPDWHRDVLNERIAKDDHDDGPGEGWLELRHRLETGG
ncbi:MAG: addiction module protein [Hyphomicrobiaceae bacterium]